VHDGVVCGRLHVVLSLRGHKCRKAISVVSKALTNLGLREKKSKRELPARACIFLGIEVDTSGGNVTVKVPEHRQVVLQKLIRAMGNEEVRLVTTGASSRLLFVGLLSFFSKATPSSLARVPAATLLLSSRRYVRLPRLRCGRAPHRRGQA
jgi:hypothetical protein